MSDIVKRLRARGYGFAPSICNKAADEIERLRAENFTLAAGACHVPDGLVGDERGNFYCSKVAEIERLRAALAEAESKKKWQPIETAPLNQRVLLIWGNMSFHMEDGIAYDDGDGPYYVLFDGDSMCSKPTHWSQIPESPA